MSSSTRGGGSSSNSSPSKQDALSKQMEMVPIQFRVEARHFQTGVADGANGADGAACRLHLLPVAIQYSGRANISTFFVPKPSETIRGVSSCAYGGGGSRASASSAEASSSATGAPAPSTDEDNDVVMEAYLRGRQLTGQRIRLPESSVGLVVKQQEPGGSRRAAANADASSNDDGKADGIEWEVVKTFDSFYLWNRDVELNSRPDVTNAVREWAHLSHALHDPLPLPAGEQ